MSPLGRISSSARSAPADAVVVLEALHGAGVVNRGAGADNVRNVTGSPTAGVDPQELVDTRPLSRAMHHHILNHRELYGLPRKFNIAFDGGGAVSAVEDTNDIGFAAVRVGDGRPTAKATGPTGRLLPHGARAASPATRTSPATPACCSAPDECVPVAAAALRRIHRARRPHRPPQGSAQVCARCTRHRLVRAGDGGGPGPHAPKAEARRTASRGPRSRSTATSGFHPQRQPGFITSACCCRSGG
jgi:ferredoxin-nitrite reductase